MERFLLISLGAVAGANARYWLSDWAVQKFGGHFPIGTLLINLSGSFLLGLFIAVSAGRLPVDPRLKLFLAVGFLGAYTTFSTYTLESFNLLARGDWLLGFYNLMGSTFAGLLAVSLGFYIGQKI